MPNELIVSHYATYFAEQYPMSLICRGDTVLDLGAGCGDFSLLAALKVGSGGRVIAVEPDPVAFTFLVRNISANRIRNVVAVQAAVWGDEPHPPFFTQKDTGSRLSDIGSARVSVVTINDLMKDSTQINVIKMDVEGAERSVFSSSIATISLVSVVFVEAHSPSIASDILNHLHEAGFSTIAWDMRRAMSKSAKNILRHPLEFLEAECRSGFYGLRAVTRGFRGNNPVDPRSGMSLIIATRRSLGSA
jgi:FkbM family methyltransferase